MLDQGIFWFTFSLGKLIGPYIIYAILFLLGAGFISTGVTSIRFIQKFFHFLFPIFRMKEKGILLAK